MDIYLFIKLYFFYVTRYAKVEANQPNISSKIFKSCWMKC